MGRKLLIATILCCRASGRARTAGFFTPLPMDVEPVVLSDGRGPEQKPLNQSASRHFPTKHASFGGSDTIQFDTLSPNLDAQLATLRTDSRQVAEDRENR
jgi:hypothetical protein